MINRVLYLWLCLVPVSLIGVTVFAEEQAGGIRGMVRDSDFDAPLAAAKVIITETGESVTTTEEGNYVFGQIPSGTYTLVFSKEGYTRQVKGNVVVSPGQMTELNMLLTGEFEEMEEFLVEDVQIGGGTEAGLLELRVESPALLDSISADLMSQAGAGDAASALKLVAGATVQDGKYATIRGLPDRYVNSQMNGVRLPSADPDKRAVQLDQFPSAVIESIQVSKTFTPDQQGDASGGAVNVVLKGIPDERVFKISSQYSMNNNVRDAGSDFLSYAGGGVSTWGRDDGNREIQTDRLGQSWDGPMGTSQADSPNDYKWSVSLGDKWNYEDFKIGAFGSFFYDRNSSFYDDGVEDRFWVENRNLGSLPYRMTPSYKGIPGTGSRPGADNDDWYTSLFDVTKASQSVQWGGLGVLGFETENHSLDILYMYTRDATDTAVVAENTRGKEGLAQYWPEYYSDLEGLSFDDYLFPDNFQYIGASPPLRYETLNYTERTTQTLQFSGKHTLPDLEFGLDNLFTLLAPELDWTVANSSSTIYQPDKRFLSANWRPFIPGIPGVPAEIWQGVVTVDGDVGWARRIWKDISEESSQYFVNLKLPFEQWSGDEGYLKFGIFSDRVQRKYLQDSFSNTNDSVDDPEEGWDYSWGEDWPNQGHPMNESFLDVDYDGEQSIAAWYSMIDLPLNSYFNIIGGVRFEKTQMSIVNHPDLNTAGAIAPTWFDFQLDNNGVFSVSRIKFSDDANVNYRQNDILPSIGFDFRPWDKITLRGSYTETVARQTFKELSPIQQQEYLGGDVFAGNPDLKMSALKNYDLRLDWNAYQGGLVSVSYFRKDVTDPIETIQVQASNENFTSVINYPEGQLSGYEFEIRQQMGHFWENLAGLSLGANATLIDSKVTVPEELNKFFRDHNAPDDPTRSMTNAPEHLYNFYMTYNLDTLGLSGTDLGLFYTIRGDTLIAGPGLSSGFDFIPSVYETEYGTLNFFMSHKFGENWQLKFQAKNLLDPDIETVYRSAGDVTKTSYQKGQEFSISLSAEF